MNGIASLLDKPHSALVEDLWHKLETHCGLTGAQTTPIPHFSWQVVEEYDMPRLESAMCQIASQTKPFLVRTTGLGLFTGPSPIVFVPLVKDAPLLRFHERIWEAMQDIAIHPSPYYAPQAWLPHITLAYDDVDPASLSCAMQTLAFQTFNWEIWVDNLILIGQGDGETGRELLRFPFGG